MLECLVISVVTCGFMFLSKQIEVVLWNWQVQLQEAGSGGANAGTLQVLNVARHYMYLCLLCSSIAIGGRFAWNGLAIVMHSPRLLHCSLQTCVSVSVLWQTTGRFLVLNWSVNWPINQAQGAYNSGKPGKLGKFLNSGKLRENSGNFKFTQGIFVSEIMGIKFCA